MAKTTNQLSTKGARIHRARHQRTPRLRPGARSPLTRRRARSAFRISPAPFLTIPAVSTRVPRYVELEDRGHDIAPIATALVDAGVLCRRHFPGSLVHAVDTALVELCDPVKSVGPAPIELAYSTKVEHLSEYDFGPEQWLERYKYRHRGRAPGIRGQLGGFAIRKESPLGITVGPALTAYEDRVPGLGQAILKILHEHMWSIIPVYTPQCGYNDAREFYWQGDETEEGMDKEEISATRADWQKGIPDWALTPKRMPREKFESACKSILTRDNAEFFQAITALSRYPEQHDHYSWFEHTSMFSTPLCLRWHDESCGIVRIFDDLCNNEFQGGDTELHVCWLYCFDTGTPASIAKAIAALSQLVKGLQLMNTALNHLAQPPSQRIKIPIRT